MGYFTGGWEEIKLKHGSKRAQRMLEAMLSSEPIRVTTTIGGRPFRRLVLVTMMSVYWDIINGDRQIVTAFEVQNWSERPDREPEEEPEQEPLFKIDTERRVKNPKVQEESFRLASQGGVTGGQGSL